MALDRLDAIVIGASVEGLVAAAALAKAGRAVAVVERESDPLRVGAGEDGVVSLETAHALDLVAHGLRFAAPPPVVGIAGDRTLVLWPDLHAARAAIAALSARDGEAFGAFQARVARAAVKPSDQGAPSAVAWLTSGLAAELPNDQMTFRISSVARLLDEAFDSDLLKGVYAQGAVAGTGVSPLAPASGALLARLSALAVAAPELGLRFVAGGAARLREVFLGLLKGHSADIRFGAEVKEIITERDVAQGVTLMTGTTLRAPLVVSALTPQRSRDMLVGLRRMPPPAFAPSARADVAPGLLKLTLGSLPKFPGLDPATLASGAVIRLNPTIARLTRAHGAFRGFMLTDEPCLELKLRPLADAAKPRWEMMVEMIYLPPVTTEGPWAGNRRDRLRALSVRTIDDVATGFGGTIEAAEILNPPESETVMDPKGPAALIAKAALDLTTIPEPRGATVAMLIKGLTVLEPSIYAGEGEAGLLAAGPRAKARADA